MKRTKKRRRIRSKVKTDDDVDRKYKAENEEDPIIDERITILEKNSSRVNILLISLRKLIMWKTHINLSRIKVFSLSKEDPVPNNVHMRGKSRRSLTRSPPIFKRMKKNLKDMEYLIIFTIINCTWNMREGKQKEPTKTFTQDLPRKLCSTNFDNP